MTLVAYPEAWKTSRPMKLPGGQTLQVISIPALAILKLVAWKDRRHTSHGKDAEDLWLLLRNYLEAGQLDRLYAEEMHLFDHPNFDLDRAGAWLLGKDARQVLAEGDTPQAILAVLSRILDPELDPDGNLWLATDMHPTRIESSLELLNAFHAGLFGNAHP